MKAKTLHNKVSQWNGLHTAEDLATLLQTHLSALKIQALNPLYKVFHVPKNNGEFRLIEDPNVKLKAIQRKLNHFLQYSYYTFRPDCCHGFSISLPSDEEPKTILSNAKAHIGKSFLLNMDMKDFFHQITASSITDHFKIIYPSFKSELVKLITELSTFKNRLPMGAPTSPVLSNICSKKLDEELTAICNACNIIYTRFADDMSFSGTQEISSTEINLLQETIKHQGFSINHGKTKLYKPGDIKMVTGLVVTDNSIELPLNYLPALHIEINRLKTVKETEYRYRTGMSLKKLNLFEQELAGKVNFAEQVLGFDHVEIVNVNKAMQLAMLTLEEFESVEWLDVPYY